MRIAEWKEKVESQGCYDAVSEMLERIEKSRLNAYITVCKDEALKMAEKYDRGELKGRLAGIPVAVKDNISTKGILTTCASKMLSNYRPVFDAHVVEKLKQEGAIIIGKANMDEFAMGTTTETSYFGVVRNPHDEARVAGGSSGGSGAVIAADEAVLSLGSDTGGEHKVSSKLLRSLRAEANLRPRFEVWLNSLRQLP